MLLEQQLVTALREAEEKVTARWAMTGGVLKGRLVSVATGARRFRYDYCSWNRAALGHAVQGVRGGGALLGVLVVLAVLDCWG